MHLPFYFRKEFLHKGIIIFANTKFSENEREEGGREKDDNETGTQTGTNLAVICLFYSNHAVRVRDEGREEVMDSWCDVG